MKCLSCGAIVAASAESCEFCGTSLQSVPVVAPPANKSGSDEIPSTANPAVTQKKVGFAEDAFNLISELKETEKNPMNWWAFFFPVAFLAGYYAKESAKKIATVVLIPVFVMAIIKYLSFSLAGAVSLASLAWTIYVYYLVSTRQGRMVNKDKPFELGTAVLYQLGFGVIYIILENL